MPAALTLTHWGHACVRLERDGRCLVLDPGSFGDLSVLGDADAVLVTHDHPDHVAADELVAAVSARPGLEVWAPGPLVDRLAEEGAPRDRLHVAAGGDRFTAAGFDVRVTGEQHAVIHPDVPRIANVAYLVEDVLLHPGDSFTPPPDGATVDVLLVPVAGPWMKVAEAVDYVRAVRPRLAVPIHDAILSDAGRALVDRLVGGLGGAQEYRRLTAAEPLVYEPPVR
ncbi:MBL fold metallo-hydrolase [Cellulomonas sp. C5510]|uniref:MBL fold metallo-hydrolase n=1 Tax=Cellulomonas sp. C5510 TaxID=2871170 RepID=UPI001C95F2CD|nr:MBL fold metallo-hydrolase [Cellulomonas sp. C5510]QZN84171.1 MBL fold metallo-hydrolase [Cellulomonas sp. C5510]